MFVVLTCINQFVFIALEHFVMPSFKLTQFVTFQFSYKISSFTFLKTALFETLISI